MSDAAAHAVLTLARSRTGLFEDGSFRDSYRTAAADRAQVDSLTGGLRR
jgi:hypothetical protein